MTMFLLFVFMTLPAPPSSIEKSCTCKKRSNQQCPPKTAKDAGHASVRMGIEAQKVQIKASQRQAKHVKITNRNAARSSVTNIGAVKATVAEWGHIPIQSFTMRKPCKATVAEWGHIPVQSVVMCKSCKATVTEVAENIEKVVCRSNA